MKKKKWLLWGVPVALVILAFGYVKLRYKLFTNPSGAMLNTIQIGQTVVADTHAAARFQDIIIFRPPKAACFPYQLDANGEPNILFLKRCLGLPGDLIEIRNGQLFRNGTPVQEGYIREKPTADFKLVEYKGAYWPLVADAGMVNENHQYTADAFIIDDIEVGEKLWKLPAARIPAGFILAMGDNRNESFDSRAWGLEPISDVVGRVVR